MQDANLIQEDWYNVAECIDCNSLYVRSNPENRVFCDACRHKDPVSPPKYDRNMEAEQQANVTLGREMAVQMRR